MSKRSEQRSDEYVGRAGLAWLTCVKTLGALEDQGLELYRMTLKGEWIDGGDMLVVLCARHADGPKVAFHHVDDIDSLWAGLRNRIRNGRLEWKEDQYG